MAPGRPKPLVRLLEERYECRETEGGCGAQRGERCKTWATGKPTPPHTDRWRQDDAHRYAEWQRRRPEPGSVEAMLAKLEDDLLAAAALVRRLEQLAGNERRPRVAPGPPPLGKDHDTHRTEVPSDDVTTDQHTRPTVRVTWQTGPRKGSRP